MSSNLRAWFKDEVKPLLPTQWRYISTQNTPSTITSVTVVYKLLELEPLPEAPLGALRARVVLTVLSPHEDDEKAEAALDDDVIALIVALDPHDTIAWESARKIRDQKSDRLGWDITVTAVITKE